MWTLFSEMGPRDGGFRTKVLPPAIEKQFNQSWFWITWKIGNTPTAEVITQDIYLSFRLFYFHIERNDVRIHYYGGKFRQCMIPVHLIVLHRNVKYMSWWRHQMETFSALLALYEGKPSATGVFPSQRLVTWSFDVFFDLRLNKRLSKQ